MRVGTQGIFRPYLKTFVPPFFPDPTDCLWVSEDVPILNFIPFSNQGKFSKDPSVFVTTEHHRAGLKKDAASIWLEDITQSSVKICLRELQNYAGSHEDIYVVSI